jgi:serine/threonine-protein kinase
MSKEFLHEINEKEEIKTESFQAEKFERIKPDKTKYVVLVSLVIVGLIASFFFMNPKVKLENLVGMNITDAKVWASNNNIQVIQKEVYAPTEEGLVLSQSIEAGVNVDQKSTLTLEVSLGYDPNEVISLPSFDETWTKTKILAWLNEQHIDDFTLKYQEDENAEPDLYMSHQLPETTTNFIRSHSIEFTLTSLPVQEEITVVDLMNFNTAQIDAWAKENEIIIKYSEAYSETIASNKVLSQSVAAGTILNPKDAIIVTLSIGPAIKIVDFASYSESAANAWAKENNIDLTIIKEYSSTVAKDVAIYQSIAKNTTVKTGTDLTLYYSLGSEVTIANYVNQTLTSLQTFVDAQNVNKASLVLNVKFSYSANVVKNKIIAQNITDTRVPIGTTIEVVVSLGDLTIVPSLVDDSGSYVPGTRTALEAYELVLQTCGKAEIVCQIIFEDNDEKLGMIASQSISAGTQVSTSTVVEVVIYE